MNLAQLREQTESEPQSRTTRSSRTGLPSGLFPVFDARPSVVQLGTNSPRSVATRVQTKLTISEPGDQYEQEADRIAAHVMSMDPAADPRPAELNAKPEALRIQRKSEGSADSNGSFSEASQSSFGSSQSLDRSTREFFESRLGENLNDVRIHTGLPFRERFSELTEAAGEDNLIYDF